MIIEDFNHVENPIHREYMKGIARYYLLIGIALGLGLALVGLILIAVFMLNP